ncbi:translocation protein SEC62 [Kwoniella heveanensis CBS 569]|uniref:Translocation protein SEC62 n=1 Tax=Kwoniella heveanensis BCC8398 TaxID=1296120 RepID=A0A1B9GKL8_9TREE|nr:translocation protein SEC62 [Kwoniella heveanensis BCC8398]OCF44747.1 translocation protein SEC62 [Kwoniella heveanensis CBS 569]
MAGPSDATPVVEAQKRAEPELKNVVEFLRGKNGPKVRRGILNGKRVDYFKGKTAIRTLLSPQYQKLKKVPAIKDEEEAQALMVKLLPFAFFLRTDRPVPAVPPPPGTPKTLNLAPQQSFDPSSYYTWFYDGSPLYTMLGGAAMVVIMLAGVMFPLWPIQLRIGVWYLSIGVLCLVGLFIALAIVRLIFWCLTVVSMKRAIWIYPNLFEDVGFFDSFRPTWAYDEPKKKKKRVAPSKSKKAKISPSASTEQVPATATAGVNGDEAAEATGVEARPAAASEAPGNGGGLRNRQAATIEEIEDDES